MIGKTALVTGAAKRVGRAIALELHAAGANLVVHYREAAFDAQALVELIERQQCELVVMGDHNPSPLLGALQGSIAHSLAHAAPVPVLLVKAPVDDSADAQADTLDAEEEG